MLFAGDRGRGWKIPFGHFTSRGVWGGGGGVRELTDYLSKRQLNTARLPSYPKIDNANFMCAL